MRFFILGYFLFSCNFLFGQVTGSGCNIGGKVAMEYLGTAPYYGGPKIVQVYKSSNYVNIVLENGYAGYNCAVLNVYSAGVRWDPVSHSNVAYPGENDIVSTGSDPKGCVVASTLNGVPDGEGPIIQYSYKKPAYCGSPPSTPVPIDDYIPFLIVVIGLFGFFYINKRKLIF